MMIRLMSMRRPAARGRRKRPNARGTSLALWRLSHDVPIRPVSATKNLTTRARHRRPKTSRFCGECGYDLAPDGDGTCPMCPRLQQIRTVLEPRVLAAERARSGSVPSDRAVIQNRSLRTSRPRAAVTGLDTTAVRSIAIVPDSEEEPAVQVRTRTAARGATTAKGKRRAPARPVRRAMPDPAGPPPAASWWGKRWVLPVVALADVALIVLIVFIWLGQYP